MILTMVSTKLINSRREKINWEKTMLVIIYPNTSENRFNVLIYKGKHAWNYTVDMICYYAHCRNVKSYEESETIVEYIEAKHVNLQVQKSDKGNKIILNISVIGE